MQITLYQTNLTPDSEDRLYDPDSYLTSCTKITKTINDIVLTDGMILPLEWFKIGPIKYMYNYLKTNNNICFFLSPVTSTTPNACNVRLTLDAWNTYYYSQGDHPYMRRAVINQTNIDVNHNSFELPFPETRAKSVVRTYPWCDNTLQPVSYIIHANLKVDASLTKTIVMPVTLVGENTYTDISSLLTDVDLMLTKLNNLLKLHIVNDESGGSLCQIISIPSIRIIPKTMYDQKGTSTLELRKAESGGEHVMYLLQNILFDNFNVSVPKYFNNPENIIYAGNSAQNIRIPRGCEKISYRYFIDPCCSSSALTLTIGEKEHDLTQCVTILNPTNKNESASETQKVSSWLGLLGSGIAITGGALTGNPLAIAGGVAGLGASGLGIAKSYATSTSTTCTDIHLHDLWYFYCANTSAELRGFGVVVFSCEDSTSVINNQNLYGYVLLVPKCYNNTRLTELDKTHNYTFIKGDVDIVNPVYPSYNDYGVDVLGDIKRLYAQGVRVWYNNTRFNAGTLTR